MSDLTGIENVGEFFSQHYLDELLAGDLSTLRKEWREASAKAPPDRLSSVSRQLSKAMGEAAQHSRPERLYDLAHPVQVAVCEALGYGYQPDFFALSEGRGLPILSQVDRQGEPYLLVIEGRFHHESEEGALDLQPQESQVPEESGYKAPKASLSDLILEAFAQEHPPRWIVLASGSEVILAERARWGRGQYLRFDLAELLGRKDATALAMAASLLCKETLVPEDGTPLHDTLNENSHKHAHGVSSELKYAARKAVELIGNEYVWYQRNVRKKGMYTDQAAADLTAECLTYLYRLLFLFYAEARAGELRSLPMNAEEYRQGYSLEALRDLEMVPLSTPESQDGYYIHESLQQLFTLVDRGHHEEWVAHRLPGMEQGSEVGSGYMERGFQMSGLHSPLFDPKNTPQLSSVKLRNVVLQEVIQLLSLSGEGRKGRGKKNTYGRGRISYAQLGINQLGSVYEGLLSYTGFFSKEKLYEVHKAGEEPSETEQAFFVPESQIERYSEDERTFTGADGEKELKVYEQGTFIFRLAGRNRETSASYYTPEVLTQCLVKYSLKELLKDKSADDILTLTVCEPALGSGAFVVEAIEQLADAYLQRKEAELGEKIPPEQYGLEKQKVKAFIATRNCYGVDLNPMAARLAEVSLWLATMHQGQAAPWFGARLGAGNSLVGARLAVWEARDLETDDGLSKKLKKILKSHADRSDLPEAIEQVLAVAESTAVDAVAAVREVFAEAERQAQIAADGGSDDDESPEADSAAQRVALIKALKKVLKDFSQPRYQRKPPHEHSLKEILASEHSDNSIYHFLLPDPGMSPFDKDKAVKELVPEAVKTLGAWRKTLSKPFKKGDADRLVKLSRRIDELLGHLLEDRQAALALSAGAVPVWGRPEESSELGNRAIDKRVAAHRLAKSEGRAYARLRLVMDLWAAQWGWPLEHADALPTRDAWWRDVEELVGVETEEPPPLAEQLSILAEAAESEALPVVPEEADVDAVDPVMAAITRLMPCHWWLEFPEVSAVRGGFDLVVGNPPWIKLQWNEQGILGDVDPRVVLDNLSAAQVAKQRGEILGERLSEYLADFEGLEGTKAFLNVEANYPLLKGVQTNLYKCFMEQGWRNARDVGVTGYLHQSGFLDDPRGGDLRKAFASRARLVVRFKNELRFFADVKPERTYCLSVSSAVQSPDMLSMSEVYHPRTVDESFSHDGHGAVPEIKTPENKWVLSGHAQRIIRIALPELALFAQLLDDPGTDALAARLPVVYSTSTLDALRGFLRVARLSDSSGSYFSTQHFNETDQQKDGTLLKETRFPSEANEWVVSGPHFYVASPLFKTPREKCRLNTDYDVNDMEDIGDDFLPRTNFIPNCSPEAYTERTPRFGGKPVTSFFRHVNRTMVSPTGERTLISAIIPPGPAHIDLVFSLSFSDERMLAAFSAITSSIVADFFVKATGKSHCRMDVLGYLPLPQRPYEQLIARAVRLNCVTNHYAELWQRMFREDWCLETFSKQDPRLCSWENLHREWGRESGLRSAFERRQALVEIDALVALSLGWRVDELCEIYRTYFRVLRRYETDTYYDARGRIVFTANSKGLPGVGLTRTQWNDLRMAGDDAPLPSWATDNLGAFIPPFDRCDREEDMRRAYYFFADKLGIDIPEGRADA